MLDWIQKAARMFRQDVADVKEKVRSQKAEIASARANCPPMFARLRTQLEADVAEYNRVLAADGPAAWLKVESSRETVIVVGKLLIAIVTKIPAPDPVAIWVRWTEGRGSGNAAMVIKCRPGVYAMGKKLIPADRVGEVSKAIIEPLIEG